MARYVDLGGVLTWYDEQGTGDPLVLLHPGGGGVDTRAFAPNLDALAERFRTFAPERRGHGHTPDVDGPITFEAMAQDTIRFLEQVVGGPAGLLGCSDGAVVALLVALRRPDLVTRLVFVAGVFHHDGWLPEAIDPNNEPHEYLAASYGEVSPDGAAHFPVVVDKLARMHLIEPTLNNDDLGTIACRTLVMFGDDDEVTLEHAIALYRTLPNAELAVIPGTSHGLLVEKPELCNTMILEFLTNDPVPTFAPIRRAAYSDDRHGHLVSHVPDRAQRMSVTARIEAVRRLYLDGIRDGNFREAVEATTGNRYTQHSTGVRDGKEGFIEFFEGFVARNPKREIDLVRVFEDGNYVFVHAYQSLNDGEARWVTTDLFDTDDHSKLVEHWDVISAFVDDTASGRTQVDGPTEIVDLDRTNANKELVGSFIAQVLIAGADRPLTDFISGDRYHQHNPLVADGLAGFGAFLHDLHARGESMVYKELHKLVGQGSFVATLCEMELAGVAVAVFDIWRLEDGRIVEHWDNMEPIPRREEWANGGKF
ncbi:MAG: alpha/beta fold hydrolase [Acidimicrobiales bacterium]